MEATKGLDDCEGAVAFCDVVQFASAVDVARFVEESDADSEFGCLCAGLCVARQENANSEIASMRIVSLRGDVSVAYRTKQVSAAPGKHYEKKS
eukprot:2495560-Pyramimonas_sp.AAC.1